MATTSCTFLHLPFTQNPTLLPSRRRSPSLSVFHRRPPTITASSSSSYSSFSGGSSPIEPDVPAIANPALANANIFYGGYNVEVIVEEDEDVEYTLMRFRREVAKAGVIQECRRRRTHETKAEEKKRKRKEAARRNRRR